MPPALLLQVLRRQPFRAFRIYRSSGIVHEIRHPELAAVGFTTLVLRVPATLEPVPVGSREMIIALRHVVQLEIIEPINPTLN